jgi:streptogramin lyase
LVGYLRTLAGGGSSDWKDGIGTNAGFNGPMGVAVDTSGNVYAAEDAGMMIRIINTAGIASALAGLHNRSGLVDGIGTNARFTNPRGLAVDASRNVYVADWGNNALRKVNSAGAVSTILSGSGVAFIGLSFSSSGELYASTWGPQCVSIISTSGTPSRTVFAGNGANGYVDGLGTVAYFSGPFGLAFNTAGRLYVADYANACVRSISSNGGLLKICALKHV